MHGDRPSRVGVAAVTFVLMVSGCGPQRVGDANSNGAELSATDGGGDETASDGDDGDTMSTDDGEPSDDTGSATTGGFEPSEEACDLRREACELALEHEEIGTPCACPEPYTCEQQACKAECVRVDALAILDCLGVECEEFDAAAGPRYQIECADRMTACTLETGAPWCPGWCWMELYKSCPEISESNCAGVGWTLDSVEDCRVGFPGVVESLFPYRLEVSVGNVLVDEVPGENSCPTDGMGYWRSGEPDGMELCAAACAAVTETSVLELFFHWC